MERMHALSLAVTLSVSFPATTRITLQEPTRALVVEVDPEVELVSLVARFAGFREYSMVNSRSPYSELIEAHFEPLREHAAVLRLRELRANSGISYDAIASLGVHLGPLPELAERVPFDAVAPAGAPPFEGRFDTRWGGAKAREFVGLLRDFARAGRAQEFFAGREAYFEEVEARLAARLSQSVALPWFDSFFGVRAGATYRAIPGLLCGGGNYGVGVRFADGTPEEISPIFGCWSFDTDGFPVFGEQYLPLFVHELCHSYTNPIIDRHFAALAPLGERLYAARAGVMQRQGYGSGRTVLYETLVRASVVRCRADTEGAEAGAAQAEREREAHFTWAPALANALREYAADRERFPTLDDFVPRIVEVLQAELIAVERDVAAAPKLVSMDPANGAVDVDATLTELVFTFDEPMQDKSWSVVGDAQQMPDFTGSPRYDRARKVLTVPVKLAPGRTYHFGLNDEKRTGFRSTRGVALLPVALQFTTRS
jgi:hypothetical protein